MSWRARYQRFRRYGLEPLPADASAEQREALIAELRARRRRRMRVVTIRSLLGMLALVVLLVALAWWLLATIGGRNVLLHQIAARLPEGSSLAWGAAEGPVSGPMTLHNVRFVYKGCPDKEGKPVDYPDCGKPMVTTFMAKTVVIDPALTPLLGRRLRLDALRVSGATLDIAKSREPFELPRWPDSLPQINPPLALQADAFRVDGLRVTQEGAPLIDIRSASGGLDASAGKLHVEHVAVDSDRGRFAVHGDYAPKDDYRTDLLATAVIPVQSRSPLAHSPLRVGLVAKGDLSAMDVGIAGALPGPVRATLALRGKDVPRWQLRATGERIDTARLAGASEPTATPLSLQLQANGVGGDATLSGQIDQGTLHAQVLPSKLALHDQVLAFSPLTLKIFDGTITVRGSGDFNDLDNAKINYAVVANGLRWGGAPPATTTGSSGATPATSPANTSVIGADASFGIAGTRAAWAAKGNATLTREDERAQLTLTGRSNGDGMTLQSLHVAMPTGTLDANGSLAWTPSLQWHLQAALAGFDPGYFAPGWNGKVDGALASDGHALDAGGVDASLVASRLGGNLKGRALGGNANLRAQGDVYDGDVALQLGDARIDGKGHVATTPRLTWNATADASHFDPGFFVADWNGAVDASLVANGQQRDDGGQDLTANVQRLGGQLRGRPLRGNGQFTMHGAATPAAQATYAGNVALDIGGSHVDAKGTIADTLDIDAAFSPLQLADLLPQAGGTLRGTLKLDGRRRAPNIDADLDGSGLQYADYRADALTLHGRLPWSASAAPGSLVANVRGLQAGLQFEHARVQASGSVEALTAQADAQGDIGALQLSATTRKRGDNWAGALETLQLAPPTGPSWRLQAPAQYAQNGSNWTLSRSCFASSGGGSLCATADWPRRGLDVTGSGFPLSLVEPYLPKREGGRAWLLHGEIALDAQLRPAGNAWRGSATVRSADGGLKLSQRARQDIVSYGNLALAADFDPQRLQLQLTSALNGDGHVDAHVSTGWDADAPLSGNVALDTDELTWLELFSPDIVEPTGRLDGRVTLGGTRAQPALGGNAHLSNFATEIPSLAIALSNGDVRMDALADGTARIHGAVQSGQGTLNVDGTLGWRGDAMPLQLSVRGNNVLASDTRDVHAVVDPDVQIKYAAGQPLSVTGTVTVPEAMLDLERLDQGVSASDDVVVLDPANPDDASGTPLDLNLTLALGDNVQLKGFGLDGSLGGQLRVRSHTGREMTGAGTLTVAGRYAAYGQKLDITRGELQWSNSPISDPLLNIRAERTLQSADVKAGVDVTGYATRPQATVWTDPASDQSNALSWLVLGRPLSGASDSEAQQVSAASAALSAGGSLLASQLGAKLGLDDAGVMESSALGGSIFGVGKYLSPRLYVGYGVSMLGTGQVLMLKYLLKKGFDLQFESSSIENRASLNWRKEK